MLFKQTQELSNFLEKIVNWKGILFLIFLALLVIFYNREISKLKENLEERTERTLGDVVSIMQNLITDPKSKEKEKLPKLVHYNDM